MTNRAARKKTAGRCLRVGAMAVVASAMIAPATRAADAAPPAAVRYIDSLRVWVLDTARTSYVLGVNEENELQSLYWGERLDGDEGLRAAHTSPEWASFDSRETMTNLEYPGWGGRYYNEPALKVTLADGVRDLVLKYDSYEIHGDTLVIRLKDIQYPLIVSLTYTVFAKDDIIRKQASIENRTPQVITIESAQSGVWYVPPGEGYRLTYLTGRWAGETQLTREADQSRQVHPGEPPRKYQPPVESVVRHRRGRRGGRRSRTRLVRCARLERQLEAGGGRHSAGAPGARDRRLQRFRFLLAAEARRIARYAALLRRLLGTRISARPRG